MNVDLNDVMIGDTFARVEDPATAYEVTAQFDLCLWRLEAGEAMRLATTAQQLTDTAGPWRRCEARAGGAK